MQMDLKANGIRNSQGIAIVATAHLERIFRRQVLFRIMLASDTIRLQPQ